MRPLLPVLLLCGCGPVEVDESTPCPSETCFRGELGDYSLDVAEELDGVCFSLTLDNDETLRVNALTAINDGSFHHSNWFWVPESDWDLPDGPWNCSEHGFSELDATLRGGVLFAQSTQLNRETQRFLPGYAVEIPPRSRIIANSHMLNSTGGPVETGLRTELELIPEEDLIAPLAPWRFNYGDLLIPAETETEHAASCDVRDLYEAVSGEPFTMRVHYALPHFHGLGQGFTMHIEGGPDHGQSVMALEDAWGHPFGSTFDPPIDLSDADGLRFACQHGNPRAVDVGYGIGDQEMCVALLFIEGAAMLDTSVRETLSSEPDGARLLRQGDCSVIGVPFPG